MDQHVEHIVKSVSTLTYGISCSLVLGDIVAIMDHHAGSFGVIIALLTYLTNFIFQCKNRKAVLKSIKQGK